MRFEPGGTREVELCEYAGTGRLVGFSGLLNGSLASHPARVEAVHRAIERGFHGAERDPRAGGGGPKPKTKAKPKTKKGSR